MGSLAVSHKLVALKLLAALASLQFSPLHFAGAVESTGCDRVFFTDPRAPFSSAMSGPSGLLVIAGFTATCDSAENEDGFTPSCGTQTCTKPGNQCACVPYCDDKSVPTHVFVGCKCPSESASGVCGDPHFKGAYGVNYDFHGVPDKDFNLISDTDLNVNAHFIGQNGEETGVDGTWLSALGVMWNEGCVARNLTVAVRNDNLNVYTTEKPFYFTVDSKEIEAPGSVSDNSDRSLLIHRDAGLSIRRPDDGRTHVIEIRSHMNLEIVAAQHEHPNGNHIDIKLEKLNVTATVHGALGQTYAESRRALLQEAVASVDHNISERFDASDIVEGKDADYMTSSLLATDNKFNRYQKPCSNLTPAKQNVVLRRLLGVELDAQSKKMLLTGAISCTSQRIGFLSCSL